MRKQVKAYAGGCVVVLAILAAAVHARADFQWVDAQGATVEAFQSDAAIYLRGNSLTPFAEYTVTLTSPQGRPLGEIQAIAQSDGSLAPVCIWPGNNSGNEPETQGEADNTTRDLQIQIAGPNVRMNKPLALIPTKRNPVIFSADAFGNSQDTFLFGQEDIYAVGRGFPSGSKIWIAVVPDQNIWKNGIPLQNLTGNKRAVELAPGETGFKVLVWKKSEAPVGGYDLVADFAPLDGKYSAPEPVDSLTQVGFAVQNPPGPEPWIAQLTCEAPDQQVIKDTFETQEDIWAHLPSAFHGTDLANRQVRIWVVRHPLHGWKHGMLLSDVRKSPQEFFLHAGDNNFLRLFKAPSPIGAYDVVMDFPPFGIYDQGVDLVDGHAAPGLLIGGAPVEARQISFNWGTGSGAINLQDLDDQPLPVPEWDAASGRREPAAYRRGSSLKVRVWFKKMDPGLPDTLTLWAVGAKGSGLNPQTVSFHSGESDLVEFEAQAPLPDYINKNEWAWQWYYALTPTSEAAAYPMTLTRHTICTTFGTNLYLAHYKQLMLWSSEWAKYQTDEKAICDVLFAKLPLSGVQYGIAAYSTVEVLRQHGGMCYGLTYFFGDLVASQGVHIDRRTFVIPYGYPGFDNYKWDMITLSAPGLNRTEPPGLLQEWEDVDTHYPLPSLQDITPHKQKRWAFYDGHSLNFLIYGGEIYLYDPSFLIGPVAGTFTELPASGTHLFGDALHAFRVLYHDPAVEHTRGDVPCSDGVVRKLTVKSSLIPDWQSTTPGDYEIDYYWY